MVLSLSTSWSINASMNRLDDLQLQKQADLARFMETGYASFSLRRHLELGNLHHKALNNEIKQSALEALSLQAIFDQVDNDLGRYSSKKQVLNDVATYLSERVCPDYPEWTKLAFKLSTAREKGCLGRNPDGKLLCAWDTKANSALLCPFDSNTETKRLIERYLPPVRQHLKKHNSRIYYVVFSCPNFRPGQLEKGKRQTFKNLSNLLRKKSMSMIQGAIARQEDPLSKGREWNVHLNAFLLTDGDLSPGLLRKQWSEYYGQDVQVYIKRLSGTGHQMEEAFLEAFKYSAQLVPNKSISKFKSRASGAPAFTDYSSHEAHEWLTANKGFRRTRSYGCLYKIPPRPASDSVTPETEWIGVIQYKTNGYEVNYCTSLRGDLIQADNSTTPPPSSPQIRPTPPPNIQRN